MWVFPVILWLVPFIVLAGWGFVLLAQVGIVDSLRYDALTRSPINSLFAASVSSLPTIRAYKQTHRLRHHFESDLVDANGRAFFTYVCFSRCLGFYADLLSLLFIFGCLLAAYVSPSTTHSEAVLALSTIFQLMNSLQFSLRTSLEICSSLASVERMQEYTKLPQEAPLSQSDDPLPGQWPLQGSL